MGQVSIGESRRAAGGVTGRRVPSAGELWAAGGRGLADKRPDGANLLAVTTVKRGTASGVWLMCSGSAVVVRGAVAGAVTVDLIMLALRAAASLSMAAARAAEGTLGAPAVGGGGDGSVLAAKGVEGRAGLAGWRHLCTWESGSKQGEDVLSM